MLARSTLAATALAFGVLSPNLALAQAGGSTGISTATLTFAPTKPQDRDHPDNPDKGPDKINLKDCTSDDIFTFNFTTTGLAGTNALLHAWLTESSQCQLAENQGAGDNLCHEVATAEDAGGLGVSIVVHVRDIVSQTFGAFTPAGPEVCTGADHPVPRKLQFYLKDQSQSSSAILGQVVEFPISYDLQGPPPPTNLKTGPGQNVLVVSWHSPDYTAQEINEYRAYRAALVTNPAGGAAGAAGASGAAGAAGSGGAAGVGGETLGPCEFAGLTPGMAPGTGVTKCGETNGRTGEVECTGLQNGVRYAVAAATVDTYYNVGVLSETVCGSPEPVTGFFEAYREAGGQGGGGYCTIGASRSRTAAVGVVLAALGFIVRRARRRALANVVAA
jgi:hypothetical protein